MGWFGGIPVPLCAAAPWYVGLQSPEAVRDSATPPPLVPVLGCSGLAAGLWPPTRHGAHLTAAPTSAQGKALHTQMPSLLLQGETWAELSSPPWLSIAHLVLMGLRRTRAQGQVSQGEAGLGARESLCRHFGPVLSANLTSPAVRPGGAHGGGVGLVVLSPKLPPGPTAPPAATLLCSTRL